MNQEAFKVALVRPKSEAVFMEPAEPLGIEALGAALLAEGIDCRLFDREMERTFGDDVLGGILAYQPTLIGLSVMTADNLRDALRLLLQVRERMPDVACVVGGLYVTTNRRHAVAQFPRGCHFLTGEGEITLPRLCKALMRGESPEPDSPYPHPTEWPRMLRHRLQDYLDVGAPINMRSSRGCPGGCTFCATPTLPEPLGRWAGRDIEDVADEMQELCAVHFPHAFNFVDDTFDPVERVEQLVEALDARSLRCALSLQLRAEDLYRTPDLPARIARLRAGGLSRIFVGLESMDPETLRMFRKPLDPWRALDAFDAVRAAGVAVHIGYILWHPNSTLESVLRETAILKERGHFTVKTLMGKLMLFPGCRLHRDLRETSQGEPRLSMQLDAHCERIAALIAPLYDAWLTGALDAPRQHCLAFLERGGAAGERARRIEETLTHLSDRAYDVLLSPDDADPAHIATVAREGKEALHAIGCTFERPW